MDVCERSREEELRAEALAREIIETELEIARVAAVLAATVAARVIAQL